METTKLDQSKDVLLAINERSEMLQAINRDIVPALALAIDEAMKERGSGVVLVVRAYPHEGTACWTDRISWQIVPEGGPGM